jgi:hypothetical protein
VKFNGTPQEGLARRATARGRIAALVAGIVVALGATAAPASAATGYDRCAHGNFCLFEHGAGKGEMFVVYSPRSKQRVNVPLSFNDKASSAWNRSARAMGLHRDANCRSRLGQMNSYGAPLDMALGSWNDVISSVCTN